MRQNTLNLSSFLPRQKTVRANFWNSIDIQTLSAEVRDLLKLNDNNSLTPGLNISQNNKKSDKNSNKLSKKETFGYMKEYLKPDVPGPGKYNIVKTETLNRIIGNVKYIKKINEHIKVKKTIGPGSYEPKLLNYSKSFSFPHSAHDNSFRINEKPLKKKFDNLRENENIIKPKKNYIKGFSFSSEDRKYYNRMRNEEIGPGSYDIIPKLREKKMRNLPKLTSKTNFRNLSLPNIGPGPGKYDTRSNLINFDKDLKQYKKMHDSAFKDSQHSDNLNGNVTEFIADHKKNFDGSPLDHLDKNPPIKKKALLNIRNKLEKNERVKISSSLLKKHFGFTSSVRKNEYNILQRLIKSPGPIYDTRQELDQKSTKIPHEKRKSLWETSLNQIPGPGSYNLKDVFFTNKLQMNRELEKYEKRHKILKTILKNN